jgi:selenide,water dikinase
LKLPEDPNLLVGLHTSDDAGVYRLDPETALVQTVDFFTPVVDDPETFGRIAAANALSDVYAMGGRPLTAMNVVGFPVQKLPLEVLQAVLRGGAAKLREAGVALAGGHSVDNPELFYGLSVTGLVHPDWVWRNRGAQPGDALVLSKALGTGIVTTALKAGLALVEHVRAAVDAMETLNRGAAARAADLALHAVTDVTGFGLVGHACEMLGDGPLGLELEAAHLPCLPGAEGYAAQGLLPGGLHRNREHFGPRVEFGPGVPAFLVDLVFDPQTSGGLLFALPAGQAAALCEELRADGLPAAVIGRVLPNLPGRIRVS